MNELKEERKTSIMFITHDLGVINQMADDVAVMYCGQVVEKAPVRVMFDKNPITPIPRADAVHPRWTPANAKLEVIPGAVPHPLDLPKGCKFAPRCKYATDKCREEEPQMVEVSKNQEIRCFYPEKEKRHG